MPPTRRRAKPVKVCPHNNFTLAVNNGGSQICVCLECGIHGLIVITRRFGGEWAVIIHVPELRPASRRGRGN